MIKASFFNNLTNFLDEFTQIQNLVIALSGGSDSMALLELAHKFAIKNDFAKNNKKIYAIHINHGINSQALEWEEHCKRWCDNFDIELSIFRLKIKKGSALEERARLARYAIFEENLKANELLLMAHHQDDLLETFLLNLFRGSGSRGLASIPMQRKLGDSWLLRPLLDVPKHDILDYLTKSQLTWVNDNSNKDTNILRNFLRIEILPKIEQNFDNLRSNFLTTIDLSKNTEVLLADLALEDLHKLEFDFDEQTINWSLFCELSDLRRNNLLRFIQKKYNFPPINKAMLDELNNLAKAKNKNIGIIGWADIELRTFANKLFFANKQYYAPLPKDLHISWNGVDCVPNIKESVLPKLPLSKYTITDRKESCKIFYKGMNRSVKKLLQEKNIAPWQRNQLPFVWYEDKLISVGKEFIADIF